MTRLLLMVVGALLVPSYVTCLMNNVIRCGTDDLPEDMLQKEAELKKDWLSRNDPPKSKNTLYIIDVYWHAVENGDKITTDEMINDSMDLLNRSYKPHFEFNLKKLKRYTDERYWNVLKGGDAEEEMKKNRKGDCSDLNVYTTQLIGGSAGGTAIGWATFPVFCQDYQEEDGVVIQYNTLAGGDYAPYDEGFTLVHEVGHWLNLIHPFEKECKVFYRDGVPIDDHDGVEDTPQCGGPNFGCPGYVDSCPDLPGADLIGNFMDYFDDACMDSFTPGQFERMKEWYPLYRCSSGNCVEYTPRPTSTSLPPSTPPSKVVSASPTKVASTEPSSSPTTSRMPSDLPSNPPSETPQCVWRKRVPCVTDECAWKKGKCSECETQLKRQSCVSVGCVWDFGGPNKDGACTTCKSFFGQKKKCRKFNCIYDRNTQECSSCLSLSKSMKDCKKAKCGYIRSKQTCAPCKFISNKNKCKSPCHWQGGKHRGKCSPPCSTMKKKENCKEPCSWKNGECVK